VTSRLRRLWTDYSADIVLIAATLLLLAVLYWLNALDNASESAMHNAAPSFGDSFIKANADLAADLIGSTAEILIILMVLNKRWGLRSRGSPEAPDPEEQEK
jgi:hypothetical protein